MRSLRFALVCLAVLFAACSAPPSGPEAGRQLVDAAAASMGGWAALDAVKTQEFVSGGADWEPLQSLAPDADPRQMNTFTQTVLVDYEKKRIRLTFDAVRVYPSTQPVEFTEIIDDEGGMLQSSDANNKLTSEQLHPSRRATRLRDFNRLPIRVLYTAKNAADLRREADKPGGKVKIEVLKYTDNGLPVEMQFDAFDRLPLRVIYTEDDPVEGDSLNEVVYGNWKDVGGGLRLPHTISTFINGRKLREEQVRKLVNNPRIDEAAFAIPQEIRAQPENGQRIVSQWTLRRIINGVAYADFGREQNVSFTEVAPGVFHVAGGSHHSAVVEMKDGLVVLEMPLFEERSAAVLAALRDKFPGKSVKYGVITHFHMDHTGGIRAYAAKGVTLLAHESIAPWVKTILARPKTIRPDSLANVGGAGTVEAVGEQKTITDGERTVELRQIPNGHASGMLIAYLPKEKILFVSDLYSPGNPIAPGDQMTNAFTLYSALTKANLPVERVIGGHGVVGSFRDLAKLIAGANKPS